MAHLHAAHLHTGTPTHTTYPTYVYTRVCDYIIVAVAAIVMMLLCALDIYNVPI